MAPTISIIGTGYVGLMTGLAFARQGLRVLCVDTDPAKVESTNRGKASFHEEGVDEALLAVVRGGRLLATLEGVTAVKESDFSFICVGTPPRTDGSMDDAQLWRAAALVGEGVRARHGRHVVVVKSTVVPGTTETVVVPVIRRSAGEGARVGICVSPEFLREGSALRDAVNPERIVIGEGDQESGDALADLYSELTCPKFRCDLRTAEMIKYATNAFLATKVSFANELANACERFHVDFDRMVEGMGLDPRINTKFMIPGLGFGGSCLPKDVRALVTEAVRRGAKTTLLQAVLDVNARQPLRAVEMLTSELGSLVGKRIAILGLSFKAGTDDVRESRAVPLCEELLRLGADVVGYDPVAMANFAKLLPSVALVGSVKEALSRAHGCVIQADWPEFRELGKDDFAGMAKRVVVDGRRTLDPRTLAGGVVYRRIG